MADVLTTWMEVNFWIKKQTGWSYWTSPPVENFDPYYLFLKPFQSLRVRCVGMWQFAVTNFRYQRWTTRAIHLIEIAIRKTASVMQVCIYESSVWSKTLVWSSLLECYLRSGERTGADPKGQATIFRFSFTVSQAAVRTAIMISPNLWYKNVKLEMRTISRAYQMY